MQTDFLQFIYQAINDLLTQNLGFFDAMGQNLFRMFSSPGTESSPRLPLPVAKTLSSSTISQVCF